MWGFRVPLSAFCGLLAWLPQNSEPRAALREKLTTPKTPVAAAHTGDSSLYIQQRIRQLPLGSWPLPLGCSVQRKVTLTKATPLLPSYPRTAQTQRWDCNTTLGCLSSLLCPSLAHFPPSSTVLTLSDTFHRSHPSSCPFYLVSPSAANSMKQDQ